MDGDFSKQEIEQAYSRVLERKVFKKSSLQERILRFLIDQAIAGNDVKEHLIGIELLGDKYDPEQNDSKVRVYVYYLRKKLAEYYVGEGKDETLKFYIKKGQYNLTFRTAVSDASEFDSKHYLKLQKKRTVIIGGGMVILFVFVIIFLPLKPDFPWRLFMGNKDVIVVVADHYMVRDTSRTDIPMFSNYRDIRSMSELNEFNEEVPEAHLSEGTFTMTTKMASYGVYYLGQLFAKYKKQFEVQLESETQYGDYSKANVIYIGQAKTMLASSAIYLQKSKAFVHDRDGFRYVNEAGEMAHFRTSFSEKYHYEYAMVSYQQLDNGNYAMFFISDHDIGVIATLKMFTDDAKLKYFLKQLPEKDVEFNALFKVTGFERTEMGCELVALEVVK